MTSTVMRDPLEGNMVNNIWSKETAKHFEFDSWQSPNCGSKRAIIAELINSAFVLKRETIIFSLSLLQNKKLILIN